MRKSEKIPLIDAAVQLFRSLLVLSVIVAVAALAVFWESLPVPIKKTVTSLSAYHSGKDEDTLIPNKYRIENMSEISENISSQSTYSTQFTSLPGETDSVHSGLIDDRNTTSVHITLDNAMIVRLNEELKQLGATACQLSYWGDNRNMFRFSCQVPFNEHNPIAVRTFQSIAPEATLSMQEVIDQVRQWKQDKGGVFRQ